MSNCEDRIIELYEEINGLYSKNGELGNEIKRLEAEMITPLENIIIKNTCNTTRGFGINNS